MSLAVSLPTMLVGILQYSRWNNDDSTLAKVGLAQRTTNFLYFKYRFAARQMSITARFNPYLVPGFPGLVIDKYVGRLVAIADRHVILEKGRVAWQGSSAALGADRALWHRYLGV